MVLITVGGIFLLKDIIGLELGRLILPAAAIGLGFYLINRNKSSPVQPPPPSDDDNDFDWDRRVEPHPSGGSSTPEDLKDSPIAPSDSAEQNSYNKSFGADFDDYLKIDNFFSDTKKNILSKNFLGGNITSIFGSTSLNFLQADLKQPVVIDTFQLFGSTKIIVPTNWKIYPNVSSIFGEVDDRRPIISIVTDDHKKIYITGTSIFGGLTIKNS